MRFATAQAATTLLTLALLGALLAATAIDLTVGAAQQPSRISCGCFGPALRLAARCIRQFFWSIRLPMTLTALVVGASLALAGLLMQTVLADHPAGPIRCKGSLPRRGFGAALAILLASAWAARWRWARRCWLR